MNYDEYKEQVTDDAREYINDEFTGDHVFEETDFDSVYDEMMCSDMVTGNGSGTYTFDAELAREYVSSALMDERILDLLKGSYDMDQINGYICERDGESLDVAIRCAILSEVYSELEDYFYSLKKGE